MKYVAFLILTTYLGGWLLYALFLPLIYQTPFYNIWMYGSIILPGLFGVLIVRNYNESKLQNKFPCPKCKSTNVAFQEYKKFNEFESESEQRNYYKGIIKCKNCGMSYDGFTMIRGKNIYKRGRDIFDYHHFTDGDLGDYYGGWGCLVFFISIFIGLISNYLIVLIIF